MTQILNSVNMAMKEYEFVDIDIFTDSSTFTIAFADNEIEIEENKYSNRYVNVYSGESEMRGDFKPSKHTASFFGF